MKRISFLLSLFIPLAFSCYGLDPQGILVMVKRGEGAVASEKVVLTFDWNELTRRLPLLTPANVNVIDQHFGKPIQFRINDSNRDGTADQVVLDFTFPSSEPVYTFGIRTDGAGHPVSAASESMTARVEIKYLVPFNAKQDEKILAQRIVESTIHTYQDPKTLSIISPGKWTYEYGFFLNGTYQLGKQLNNDAYLQYTQQWVDNFIDEKGFKPGVYNPDEYRLDDVMPGRLCIWLNQQTGQKKYKKIVDTLITQLTRQPKTSDGGYWHKEIYPNQMWLDGIFMGDIFSMQYAAAYKDAHWFDEAVKQIKLMYSHAQDPKTGLLYHGWDESKNKVWADQVRGTSPELWSRAIGWYAMALIECLEYLPKNHPERKNIEVIFKNLCASIKKYQDPATALWFQVIDKGSLSDNWIETSASAMFIYAFTKGQHKGLLDKSFASAAEKGYTSLVKKYIYVDDAGDIHLDQAVKVGSLNMKNSKGDYNYYITCERRIDDYKGLAALLYASMELKK